MDSHLVDKLRSQKRRELKKGIFVGLVSLKPVIWHVWELRARTASTEKQFSNPHIQIGNQQDFFSGPWQCVTVRFLKLKKRHFGHVRHSHLIHDEQVTAALLSPGFEQKVRRKRDWYWNEHCCGAEGGEACSNSSVRPQCCAAAENKLWSRCVYSVHGLLQGQSPRVQICQAFVKRKSFLFVRCYNM